MFVGSRRRRRIVPFSTISIGDIRLIHWLIEINGKRASLTALYLGNLHKRMHRMLINLLPHKLEYNGSSRD